MAQEFSGLGYLGLRVWGLGFRFYCTSLHRYHASMVRVFLDSRASRDGHGPMLLISKRSHEEIVSPPSECLDHLRNNPAHGRTTTHQKWPDPEKCCSVAAYPVEAARSLATLNPKP